MVIVRIVGLALLGGILACASSIEAARTQKAPEQIKAEMEQAASSFMGELRSVLLRQMQQGALEAVAVCSDSAQLLTQSIGRRHGVSIRRTSERYRNPMNEPTERDLAVLERFSRLLSGGAAAESLEEFDQVDRNGRRIWRLSKPIMVSSSVCLQCHGTDAEISPQIQEFLSVRYPGDRAQGYAVGDFRGIVVVSEITPEDGGAF